jgi:hypothetical protein
MEATTQQRIDTVPVIDAVPALLDGDRVNLGGPIIAISMPDFPFGRMFSRIQICLILTRLSRKLHSFPLSIGCG